MRKILIIAHRGASGTEPENTLLAFETAIEMKADAIEFDVQLSKSKEVMVFHDTKLKRMTGKKGKLKKKKLAKLLELDLGKGQRIPTLKETLDQLDARIDLNIELKARKTAVPTALLIQNAIRTGHWKAENFFISSFYYKELRRFHELSPDIPVSLLYNGKPKKLKKRVKILQPVSVHLNAKKIKKKWIDLAHEYGLKVYIWTVDDPQVAQILYSDGADGIFTNYPDRLIKSRRGF
ncbi:MAG: glycerophosphodiester phosphodiesterase [Candidatus Neomarinimicrobiota bacterium]|jgi:glycerophosphoryl diester phosphodiesterase